ncbi:coiled-coil domain-containing protein 74B isoform X2 [Sebastes fasciatus]|uniref:coiled-coil domain-containing protein 74B isoform X2 n=1 Tax=Sebastes fasciatus TaxID=394691 RepID=UPI003D9E498E
MSSHNLPPLRHLPQWTRVGRLGKPCCSPRRLPAPENQLQPLPVAPPPADRGGVWRAAAEVSSSSRHSNNIMDHRVASMERNIQFLQLQHKDTLEKLHAEIDYLRRENKELQYKLIMEPPKSSRKGMSRSRRGVRPPTQGSDAHMGLYLEEPLQDTRPAQDQALSAGEGSEMLGSARQDRGPEVKGGLITSLQPLRIHSNPSHPPRAPTLQECEVIIRQLYNANSLQSQEVWTLSVWGGPPSPQTEPQLHHSRETEEDPCCAERPFQKDGAVTRSKTGCSEKP